jgi:hypothetical protein
VDVAHDRLRDPGNLLGVPLLRLATSGVVLLAPPGGGLLGAFVASTGRLYLSIEARFSVGQGGGQLSQLLRMLRHLAVFSDGPLLGRLRRPLIGTGHGVASARGVTLARSLSASERCFAAAARALPGAASSALCCFLMAAILSRYSFSDTASSPDPGPRLAASTTRGVSMCSRFAAHRLPAGPLGEGAAPAGVPDGTAEQGFGGGGGEGI